MDIIPHFNDYGNKFKVTDLIKGNARFEIGFGNKYAFYYTIPVSTICWILDSYCEFLSRGIQYRMKMLFLFTIVIICKMCSRSRKIGSRAGSCYSSNDAGVQC